MATNDEAAGPDGRKRPIKRQGPPEVYAIVVECQDETQQREMFERLKGEGVKVRVLVL